MFTMLKMQSGLSQQRLQPENRVEAAESRVELMVAPTEKDSCETDQTHRQACGIQDEGDTVLLIRDYSPHVDSQ
jgi:hypothetical protein